MKIEDKRKKRFVLFDDVKGGDVIIANDGGYYMALDFRVRGLNEDRMTYNAVRINNGFLTFFNSDDVVEKTDAKVIIGDD